MNNLTIFKVTRRTKFDQKDVFIHSHNYSQIIAVISGEGIISAADQELVTHPQHIYYIPEHMPHKVIGLNQFTAYYVDFFNSKTFLPQTEKLTDVEYGVTPYEFSIVEDIFNESAKDQILSGEIISLRLEELFLRIIQREVHINRPAPANVITSNTSVSGFMDKIKYILEYIDENITENLTSAKIAEMYGFSSSYFSTTFKIAVGYAPTQYITYRKLQVARDLLVSSKMNVTQVAEYLGFQSIHYFSRVFKNYYGVSPKKFTSLINKSEVTFDINRKLDCVPIETILSQHEQESDFLS